MLKNPTPQQISFFSSLWIVGSLLFVATVLWLSGFWSVNFEVVLLLLILGYGISYFVILYYLKKYIYRKIKLIYKTIHKHKLHSQEKNSYQDVNADILDEVEKEVEAWATNQAQEIAELKSWQSYRRRFLGDISHELKTPIFTIQGYLDTLLDGAMADEKINQLYLERAAKNVQRLNTIVEDLESISRMESGELMLEVQSFNIRELTQEVFEDLEIKALENDITFLFKSGADENYMVNADRESIRQVLTNLLNNSVKYGKKGGSTKVSFYDMDKNILVEVADNGIGIEAEFLDRIFDRFYRVDKSRSRDRGGSGLGLSIVKHIINAHKQTINVRSTINLGSTFGFTLEKA
ncbi:MAG: sensor histidine kinase [Saprospiraceae bacterium]|nr:sensor histidine kinase [Saprospiraceae bacterium]